MAENTEIIRQRLFKTENYLGPFNPDRQGGYDALDQCSLFGCVWQSKNDNNTTAPAVWDGGEIITPNTTDWEQVSGDYEAWLLNKDKPATTGTTGDYPYNGMGRVRLKKHMVNGHNLLYQDDFYKGEVGSRVPNTNTVFEVPYEFELAEDITIPANCVLEFDGGSLNNSSESTITLNLNDALLQGTPRIINCVVTNPHNDTLNFSWLGIGSDAAYNTKTLTWLADADIDWVVDIDCELNSSITITNRINITSPFVDTSHLKTISFPNSAGFVFSANPYHEQTCIENFILIAKGNAIEYTGYTWNTYIKNLRVQSEEGNAITFANNFQVHIMDCWLYAPSGYCVDNLKGTTSSVTRVSVGPCLAAYHNCITTWISCNGVWNKDIHGNDGIVKNWYLWDLDSHNYYIKLTFINCNIESVAETAILSTTNKGNVFYIKAQGLTFHSYKNAATGKREYPIINLVNGNIAYIEGVHFSGGLDDFAVDVYPIMQGGFIDNYYPLLKFDFENPVYIKAGNKEGEFTSINQCLATAKRPSSPLEGYSYYDLTLHKQVWYNGTNYVDAAGTTV